MRNPSTFILVLASIIRSTRAFCTLRTGVEISNCPNAPDPRSMAIDVPAAIFAKHPPNDKHVEYFCIITPTYEAVKLIYRELTSVYKQSEIDWKVIHNAGCTRDDTDLPDHVTAPNDLNRLISVTFRSFLTALPTPPTIVTIARSSEDEYCPPEDVDQIQMGVLEELRECLGDIDIQLAYQEEEQSF